MPTAGPQAFNSYPPALVTPLGEGYAGPWALERLEVRPDAKVNLTNRQGFVFQDPNVVTPEVLYVKELRLHPGAILNTALQRLYYQSLVDESGAPLLPPDPNDPNGTVWQPDPNDPNSTIAHGSYVVDLPLLGFSLKIIAMEDDDEFAVRVRTRVRDPNDLQPDPPAQPLEGSIQRITDPYDPNNGVMEMRTRAGRDAGSQFRGSPRGFCAGRRG